MAKKPTSKEIADYVVASEKEKKAVAHPAAKAAVVEIDHETGTAVSVPKAGQFDQPELPIFEIKGRPYIPFMSFLMRSFGAESYFEIGTRQGVSLSGATCKSVAVDPAFAIKADAIGQKEICMFFQMPSDHFFQKHNLTSLLGGPFSAAFLDGFHVFEYLLRDFMHTEKHGRRNSVIFLHDCLPRVALMAERRPRRDGEFKYGWTGDVWKVVPILKKYRPDLRIYALDCPPSGLIMITNLDPSNTTLEDKYYDIVKEFEEGPKDLDLLLEFKKSTETVKTREINDLSDLAKLCWV